MCARFLHDQSKLVILHESGLYANISGTGQWPGLVQSHDITEEQNVIETRFLGNLRRDIGRFDPGPLDVTGTIEFYPQDWRLLGFAIGSITTTSGTSQSDNYRFDLSAVNSDVRQNAFTSGVLNPFMSFSLEESTTGVVSSRNFMRTIRGCVVNSYELSATQGEPVTVTVEFIGQAGSWFSGTTTSVTAGSNRPYLWSDAIFQIAGVTQETVKDLTFTLNNNFEPPHYVNGSRVIAIPYPLNREYIVEVTQDLTDDMMGSLYDTYFVGGSLFNSLIDINNTVNTGSHRVQITLSGCRITEMTVPVEMEGVREVSYTIHALSGVGAAFDRLPLYTPF